MKKLLLTTGSVIATASPIVTAVSCSSEIDTDIQSIGDEIMGDLYIGQEFKSVAHYNEADELKVRYVNEDYKEADRQDIFSGPTQIVQDAFYADPSVEDVKEYGSNNEITGAVLQKNYEDQVNNLKDIIELTTEYLANIEMKNNILAKLSDTVNVLEDVAINSKDRLLTINTFMNPFVYAYIQEDHKTSYNASIQLPGNTSMGTVEDDYLFVDTEDSSNNITMLIEVILNVSFPSIMESSKLVEAFNIYENL